MKNKKIILAGGTGFIGQALAARWGKENHVVILTRGGAPPSDNSALEAIVRKLPRKKYRLL